MRNGCLWSDVVFEKEVISREFDFKTSYLEFWGLEIKHLKAHDFVWQGCFFLHFYLATSNTDWAQISQVCYFMHCQDTPSKKTSLWQLPIVSCVFKKQLIRNKLNISSAPRNPFVEHCLYKDGAVFVIVNAIIEIKLKLI